MKIMASGPITSWQIDGENNGNSDRLYFLGLQNQEDGDFVDVGCGLWMVTAAMKLNDACTLVDKL